MSPARTPLALAVLACLALSAAAAIPDGFSNPGGPPFLEGASYSEDSKSVGYTLISAHHSGESNHSSFVFVNSLPEGLVVEAGDYTSWECASTPGYYVAIAEVVVTAADGVSVEKTVCEYGTLDAATKTNSWAWGVDECPTAATEGVNILQVSEVVNSCAAA